MKRHINIFSFLFIIALFFNCNNKDSVAQFQKDPTPYDLNYGNLETPNLPSDNPLTTQGVQLGRMLFYEKRLSKNNTQSCSDCHQQANGFSDTTRFSIGVDGLTGTRQAMGLFNLAWHQNGFFWDGRASTLREQALLPIQDPLEMNESLDNVINKLSQDQIYREQFALAFGTDQITSDLIGLAIEQFMLSIVSYQSKYDQYRALQVEFSDSEIRGMQLFFSEFNPSNWEVSGGNCVACHQADLFHNEEFVNNGLDTDEEFVDFGREDITGDQADRAKFKTPSLRNIALTAPYMHDGRFNTLLEVLDFYNEGIQLSSTIDNHIGNTNATGLRLTVQDKTDLISFLHTLTDESFKSKPEYSSPF